MTLGRLVKLLGNLAVEVLAMAEAFRIANGFLPVREFPPEPLTRFVVPEVLVELDMPLAAGLLEDTCCFPLEPEPPICTLPSPIPGIPWGFAF